MCLQLGLRPKQQEEPAELHYASVHFSKQKDECLYSNVGPAPAPPRRLTEEEDPAVVYSAIRCANDGH